MTRELEQAGFELAADQATVTNCLQFLAAQGWAGLHCGDHLRRLELQGVPAPRALWALAQPSGGVRAAAVWHAEALTLVAPLAEDRETVAAFLGPKLPELQRALGPEGQMPPGPWEGFGTHVRWVTVATSSRGSARLPVREARLEDAERIHAIYDSVSWMRLDSPAQWVERLRAERTWVAELEGKVVAASRWTRRFVKAVEIGAVATDPAFRRRGAAAAVVLAASRAALEQGLTPVLCYGDPALSQLYQPLGFELVGSLRALHRSP